MKNYFEIPYPHPWIVIGAVSAVTVLAILFSINDYYREYFETSEYIATLPMPKAETALIELDFGSGNRRVFRGTVDKEVYPLDIALRSAAENGNFSFGVRNGTMVELAGISGEWNIYRNGEATDAPWDELAITGGDRYTFRYEK